MSSGLKGDATSHPLLDFELIPTENEPSPIERPPGSVRGVRKGCVMRTPEWHAICRMIALVGLVLALAAPTLPSGTAYAGPLDWDGDGIPNKVDNCKRDAEDFDGFMDADGCPDLDHDNDTVMDADEADGCVGLIEDIDKFEDTDGCPDSDNDGDGVLDVNDQCPSPIAGDEVKEDFDGWEDTDGCPDPDNDGDGVADTSDGCPDKAEDPDGHEDTDGCPDMDNDGDGFIDTEDDCPNDAAPEGDLDGCPDKDTDSDGIVDEVDLCPSSPEDKDDFEDTDGCPERDNDGDNIPDTADRCPNHREDFDGFKDEDGCPEPNNDGDAFIDELDRCPDDWAPPEDGDGCPEEPIEIAEVTVHRDLPTGASLCPAPSQFVAQKKGRVLSYAWSQAPAGTTYAHDTGTRLFTVNCPAGTTVFTHDNPTVAGPVALTASNGS